MQRTGKYRLAKIDKTGELRYHGDENHIVYRLMPEQRGTQSRGRIGAQRRRTSFFSPSPSANPVGVEEGHLVRKCRCPFLLVQAGHPRRRSSAWPKGDKPWTSSFHNWQMRCTRTEYATRKEPAASQSPRGATVCR